MVQTPRTCDTCVSEGGLTDCNGRSATFPDSEIKTVARTGKVGPITSSEFVVGDQFFMGYNGGPYFTFSQGFSLFVNCKDQREVDEYWNKLVSAGATPLQCGWITDPFGVTWQIVPSRFMELIADKNPKRYRLPHSNEQRPG